MKGIIFGETGLEVSAVCYGSWQLDERFWGASAAADHIDAMRRAVEVGVNFFDTADAYGEGRSEEVMGEALSVFERERLVITTKVYHNRVGPDSLDVGDLSRKTIVTRCEESLKRLRTDYIDIYLAHSYDRFTDIEQTVEALEDLKGKGKIRHYGMSNFTAEQIRLACGCGNWEVVQPRFSFLRPESEDDILPLARSMGLGVMTYSPLFYGLLTGKYTGEETEHRRGHPYFRNSELFKEIAGRVRALAPVAEENGLTITQLVLACVLANPMINACIVGIRNRAYIEEAAGAMEAEISREDYYRVRAIIGRPPKV